MLTAVLGDQRSGKNTFLSRIALINDSNNKKELWSNFELDLDTYNKLEIIDLLYLNKNVIVFIDEAYAWLESRTSGSNVNRFISHIIFQASKRQFDMYVSAQMYSSVDIRFRDQANYVVRCANRNEYDDFKYTITKKGKRSRKTVKLSYDIAEKRYFPLFNTYEIINAHNIQNLEFKLLETYPDKLDKKVKQICKEIRPLFKKKISHDTVRKVLLNNHIVLGFAKYVYIELKDLIN